MANYRRRDFELMFCFRFLGRVSGLGGALIFLSCVLVEPSAATTHWVVTEDGKIQQQVDSPLNLKHPHDLVIFMRQETRVSYLKELEVPSYTSNRLQHSLSAPGPHAKNDTPPICKASCISTLHPAGLHKGGKKCVEWF
ncbi:UNVERIFIED_CONTAM: hypothetical protein FKN15_010325 [Acipenser sinensis]